MKRGERRASIEGVPCSCTLYRASGAWHIRRAVLVGGPFLSGRLRARMRCGGETGKYHQNKHNCNNNETHELQRPGVGRYPDVFEALSIPPRSESFGQHLLRSPRGRFRLDGYFSSRPWACCKSAPGTRRLNTPEVTDLSTRLFCEHPGGAFAQLLLGTIYKATIAFLRTLALSEAAMTSISLFCSLLSPVEEAVLSSQLPVSTPLSEADAWLISSWKFESTLATASAMRLWFSRTFSCNVVGSGWEVRRGVITHRGMCVGWRRRKSETQEGDRRRRERDQTGELRASMPEFKLVCICVCTL